MATLPLRALLPKTKSARCASRTGRWTHIRMRRVSSTLASIFQNIAICAVLITLQPSMVTLSRGPKKRCLLRPPPAVASMRGTAPEHLAAALLPQDAKVNHHRAEHLKVRIAPPREAMQADLEGEEVQALFPEDRDPALFQGAA